MKAKAGERRIEERKEGRKEGVFVPAFHADDSSESLRESFH